MKLFLKVLGFLASIIVTFVFVIGFISFWILAFLIGKDFAIYLYDLMLTV